MTLFIRLVSVAATYASFYSLYFTFRPISQIDGIWETSLLCLTILLCCITIFVDARAYLIQRPKAYKKPSDVNAYMRSWLSARGRALVFSRDLSWAENDHATKQLMITKSKQRELIVVAEHKAPFTDKLRSSGAKVIYYEGIGYVPKSRFTITDFGKSDARVAIGGKINGVHIIEEHATSSVVFNLAQDLAQSLIQWEQQFVSQSTAP
ncbi:hypothetical protein HFO55_34490 [Rhizobium leguminosarum]|uniref:hypothetical protein n=1 Tax=Rhizobium leguminosarum TaxID=384 RepID=UPI001C98CA36|nr:hypothetical protein [Rhizobium leguminosarum]MBY5572206.1 hypothetical protein [Rhizobium leguminosarum]MBY5578811.1 hypothetical protein [Rhizobium leguminosarum]